MARGWAAMAGEQEPTPVRIGLERYLRHLGAPPPDVIQELSGRWADFVGPGLATRTRPRSLLDGHLVVQCEDGAWASQLGWMEAQIIERITQQLPTAGVVRITTRTG
ncbi:MAG: DUF721 domain-containing protein [Actinomycetota bacterium]